MALDEDENDIRRRWQVNFSPIKRTISKDIPVAGGARRSLFSHDGQGANDRQDR